jgi:RNA-directed DNA polymerase
LRIQKEHDPPDWQLGKPLADTITSAGFKINPDKTRMQLRGSRQTVTGLTVNQKVNIQADYYRRVRSMCYELFKTGVYFHQGSAPITALPVLEGATKSLLPRQVRSGLGQKRNHSK